MADRRLRASRPPTRRALACALAGALAVLALTPRARADELRDGVGAALVGFGGVASLDHGLRAGSSEPDLLASRDPRLEGTGGFGGAGVRVLVVVERYRFTFEEAVFGVGGSRYRLDGAPLPASVSSDASGAWGAHFSVSAGRQFDLGPLSPYAELRAGTAFTATTVNLRSAAYGYLGATNYTTFRLLLAPTVGAVYRLGRGAFVDVAVSGDVTGPERFGASIALGVWLGSPHYGPRRRGWHW